MTVSQLSAFIDKCQDDEQLMLKIKDAHKQANSAAYLVDLGTSQGFEFTVDDLLEEDPDFKNEETSDELDAEELSSVAGGFGGISAKNFRTSPRKTMIAKMARVMNAKIEGKALLDSGMSQICWPATAW